MQKKNKSQDKKNRFSQWTCFDFIHCSELFVCARALSPSGQMFWIYFWRLDIFISELALTAWGPETQAFIKSLHHFRTKVRTKWERDKKRSSQRLWWINFFHSWPKKNEQRSHLRKKIIKIILDLFAFFRFHLASFNEIFHEIPIFCIFWYFMKINKVLFIKMIIDSKKIKAEKNASE